MSDVTTDSTTAKTDMAKRNLEQYVENGYKIFIDTCSMMGGDNINIDGFWGNVIPILHKYNAKIIVPVSCVKELTKNSEDASDAKKSDQASRALKTIKQLHNAGYIELRGEATDGDFADHVFKYVFMKFRMSHNLLLITQDRKLAEEILSYNDSEAVKSRYKVQVRKINPYGFLSTVFYSEGKKKLLTNMGSGENQVVPEEEKFRLCTTISNITDEILPVTHIPSSGEDVYVYTDKWNKIRLGEQLGKPGGEGTVYKINDYYVAKIYHKEKNTKRRFEKLKLMLSKNIKYPGICYPVALIYNSKQEFIGFIMPSANGVKLMPGVFIKPQIIKNFPNWKKRDTVELCITILDKIKYLHDRNIIMGDINPANILVVSSKDVYFVDTDSYQIQDYPCSVGTINYTAPEIQNKNFGSFLRTVGNENFAVATLLFMIMLPGKPPYAQQGGDDQATNIINMDFSYPLGAQSNKKTPDGSWRFIWSHLTYDLKEAFYNTFRKDGDHSKENTRLSVEEWLSIFRYYLELLDSGKYGQQDKMSEEIFPTRYKKCDKFTYVKCRLCGKEVPEDNCQNGICRECLNKGETYQCSRCGKDIIYTNYHRYIKQAKRYKVCHDCYEWGQKVWSKQYCTNCGCTFEITNQEWEFYQKKRLDIPKRCKQCREAKKSGSNTQNSIPYFENSSPVPSPKTVPLPKTNNKGSFCFITTAVCDYYGKPDNCYELTTLRHYRDTWLRAQPDGESLIAEYYASAPLIVSKLRQSPFYPYYCRTLMSKYITPCLELIEKKKYNECKDLYVAMFNYISAELK